MQQQDNKTLFDFLEKIYELRINNHSNAIDSIETKACQLLAGIGIFLPLALAIVTNNTNLQFNSWIFWGCITSFFCILASIFTLWAKIFKIRPKLNEFYNDIKDSTDFEMRKEALKDMQKALDDNSASLKNKGWVFNIMMLLFCISILLISLGILVQKINFMYNTHGLQKYPYGKQLQQPTKPAATASAKPK